jgi:hypothetical protein
MWPGGLVSSLVFSYLIFRCISILYDSALGKLLVGKGNCLGYCHESFILGIESPFPKSNVSFPHRAGQMQYQIEEINHHS